MSIAADFEKVLHRPYAGSLSRHTLTFSTGHQVHQELPTQSRRYQWRKAAYVSLFYVHFSSVAHVTCRLLCVCSWCNSLFMYKLFKQVQHLNCAHPHAPFFLYCCSLLVYWSYRSAFYVSHRLLLETLRDLNLGPCRWRLVPSGTRGTVSRACPRRRQWSSTLRLLPRVTPTGV